MTAPAAKKAKPKSAGRKAGSTSLTPKEKAEAVSLWRTGGVTLQQLADKFKRRPETMGRLFKRMGIVKGSAIKDAADKLDAAAIAAATSDQEETLRRIRLAKDEHYRMSNGLAKLVWAEIVRCRQANLPLHSIKETMATLKLASDVIGNSRKELYTILQVDEADKKKEEDDLPELVVRELTENEVEQIQTGTETDEDIEPVADIEDIDIPDGS